MYTNTVEEINTYSTIGLRSSKTQIRALILRCVW
jgi:hypothetical protein